MLKKTIILTGFEKFGSYSTNLSSDIVKNFDENLKDCKIEKLILPVSWIRTKENYITLLKSKDFTPLLVILLGVHSRNRISLEKLSLNWAVGKDIDGHYRFGPINRKNPFKLRTNVNIDELYNTLKYNIRLSKSSFPGFYLCNYIYFWALNLSRNKYPVIFIHVRRKGNLEDYLTYIKRIIEEIIKLI